MKKIIILLLIPFSLFGCGNSLQGVKKSDYGFVTKEPLSLRKQTVPAALQYIRTYYPDLDAVSTGNQPASILKKYLPDISNKSMEGRYVFDTIVMVLVQEENRDFLEILEAAVLTNPANRDEIEKIISLYNKNDLIFEPQFVISSCFQYTRIIDGIIVALPNVNWVRDIFGNNLCNYSAGTSDYFCSISGYITDNKNGFAPYKKGTLPETFSITNGPGFSEETVTLKEIKSGKVILISNTPKKLGEKTFDRIYERITLSTKDVPDRYFMERTRYYVNKNNVVTVHFESTINTHHAMADIEHLMERQRLILDSVYFENTKLLE